VIHPFEKPREYKRALNAAKLGRVFAKPFVENLTGHYDGVYCISRHYRNLTWLISGSCDGEIRMWNSASGKCTGDWKAHTGFVRGLTSSWDLDRVYSCGSDKLVQLWELPKTLTTGICEDVEENPKPIASWISNHALQAIDHQRKSSLFATVSANVVNVWDPERSEPIQKLVWGDDTLNTIRFNPIETNILATTSEDRSISLYDIRGNIPIRKLVMKMRSNSLAWNPMEAFNFTFGNEDHNAYTFDMRNLDIARNVYTDHVAAILAIDYSPTGQEFVTGSYDKTLRIFPTDKENSREIYYTKRMQRIYSVMYSGDGTYIFTGSDDTNIRVWKTRASQNLRAQHGREIEKLKYYDALVERYKDLPEIKKIHTKRFVPKVIKNTQATKTIIKQSERRKQENLRRHSKPGKVPIIPEKKKKYCQKC